MCLGCGYDGAELQRVEDGPYECPHCFQDLYERPAMSYAEMEGLEVVPVRARTVRERVRHEARLFTQWMRLWLAFVAMPRR